MSGLAFSATATFAPFTGLLAFTVFMLAFAFGLVAFNTDVFEREELVEAIVEHLFLVRGFGQHQ